MRGMTIEVADDDRFISNIDGSRMDRVQCLSRFTTVMMLWAAMLSDAFPQQINYDEIERDSEQEANGIILCAIAAGTVIGLAIAIPIAVHIEKKKTRILVASRQLNPLYEKAVDLMGEDKREEARAQFELFIGKYKEMKADELGIAILDQRYDNAKVKAARLKELSSGQRRESLVLPDSSSGRVREGYGKNDENAKQDTGETNN
jgi:hypothetical protein